MAEEADVLVCMGGGGCISSISKSQRAHVSKSQRADVLVCMPYEEEDTCMQPGDTCPLSTPPLSLSTPPSLSLGVPLRPKVGVGGVEEGEEGKEGEE